MAESGAALMRLAGDPCLTPAHAHCPSLQAPELAHREALQVFLNVKQIRARIHNLRDIYFYCWIFACVFLLVCLFWGVFCLFVEECICNVGREKNSVLAFHSFSLMLSYITKS